MWEVPTPAFTVADTVGACTFGVRDTDLVAAVKSQLTELEKACKRLADAVVAGTAHTLTPGDFKVAGVEDIQMEWLYDRKMAKAPAPGKAASMARVIYDQMLAAAIHKRCPLCGLRFVGELDHYLPKTKFAALTICPYNLVPVCKDCNFIKRDSVASSASDEFLHPYAPFGDGDIWLTAKISAQEPPLVRFQVTAPAGWSANEGARARSHFDKYGLGNLYTISTISLMASIAGMLTELHAEGGPTAVKKHLMGTEQSYRAVRPNSWEAAMYEALHSDPDFCDGKYGFAPA